MPLVIIGTVAITSYMLIYTEGSQKVVNFIPRVFGNIAGNRMIPTHIFFDTSNDVEIISDFNNNRFLYRDLGKEKIRTAWKTSIMTSLRKPHAITYHPVSKKYFAVDTANNQIISFSNLDGEDAGIKRYSELAGHKIGKRPHDIAYNTKDGYVYVMLNRGVIRFLPTKGDVRDTLFISKETITEEVRNNFPDTKLSIGYMRAITINDGVVYLINSTQGNVIQMNDFSDPTTWSVHINKNRPQKYAEAGTFDKDGLILNDVDYYKGYWYATNYYPSKKHNYLGSKTNTKNKIIRWKSWDDFENSKWEDLSHLAHPESIPYYFSKYDNRLFISMFHVGNSEGKGSGIYEIKTSSF